MTLKVILAAWNFSKSHLDRDVKVLNRRAHDIFLTLEIKMLITLFLYYIIL